MTPAEILALIVSVITILKAILFIWNPKWLSKLAMWPKNQRVMMQILIVIFLIFVAGCVLRNFGIIALMLGGLFGMMTFALLLLQNPKIYDPVAKQMLKNRKGLWLVFLIWLILSVWTLWYLFI